MAVTGSSAITFVARLCRPADSGGDESWTFFDLPTHVSDALPSRGQVAALVEINNVSTRIVLQPNGTGGHWIKINAALQQSCGIQVGEPAEINLLPTREWPEPELPVDFAAELETNISANATWQLITTAAKTDWIFWLESAKKAETRQKRIQTACDMLANGKRRVCCFDRSGMYSNSLRGPVARN